MSLLWIATEAVLYTFAIEQDSARVAVVAITALTVSGCVTSFREHHYYQSVTPKGEASNYYRLTVSGYAAMSSARYISGYYDERAVDLYFDELKVTQTSETQPPKKIFRTDLTDPGSQDVIKPLSPTNEYGTFVMILSTNASDGPRVRRRVEHADQVPSRWPGAGHIWNLLPHLARADRSENQRGRRSGVLGCSRAGSDCMTATRRCQTASRAPAAPLNSVRC